MKKLSIQFCLVLASLFVFITACEKGELKLPGEAAGEGARVRFFTLAHNLLDANANALQLNVKVNNKIINGTQVLTLTTATFPSLDYAILPAGNLEYSFNRNAYGIQRTGRRDSVSYTDSLLSKGNFNFQAGKYYSVFLADSTPNLSTVVLEDNFSNLKDDKAYVRLLNLTTKNGTKNDTFELVRRRDNLVIGKVAYNQPSAFLPIDASRPDSFFYRRPGVTTTTFPGVGGFSTTLGFTSGRNYTFLVTGTTSRVNATRVMLITHQ
jgi:hypothetical protein